MITVETLRKCSFLDSITIETALRKSYPKDSVLRSEFVGITNGGQFAYNIAYPDEDAKSGMAVTKLYVWQGDDGELVADY